MSTITRLAPAKINTYLEILGKDESGFHVLETIFQTISLHDTIHVTMTKSQQTELRFTRPPGYDCPTTAGNLAWEAAEAYRRHQPGLGGVSIELDKHIPAGGGLGGGSSDAGAVLLALAELDPEPLPASTLHQLACTLGSDVPFFLIGGRAHATGRGDVLTPLPAPPAIALHLLLPPFGCSTPAVFKALTDAERGPREALGSAHWRDHDPLTLRHNRLTTAAARVQPALTDLFNELNTAACRWWMTGSGSTIVSLDPLPDGLPGRVVTCQMT